jgi:hypothetical protein
MTSTTVDWVSAALPAEKRAARPDRRVAELGLAFGLLLEDEGGGGTEQLSQGQQVIPAKQSVDFQVSLDDIVVNDYNLNIPRYVEPKNNQINLTVEEAMKQLRKGTEAAFEAEERLIEILRREGLLIDGKI